MIIGLDSLPDEESSLIIFSILILNLIIITKKIKQNKTIKNPMNQIR